MTEKTEKTKLTKPSWSEAAKQYCLNCGYHLTKDNARTRTKFYLGKDEAAAILQAAKLVGDWATVKKDWKRYKAEYEAKKTEGDWLKQSHNPYAFQISIGTLDPKPVWPTKPQDVPTAPTPDETNPLPEEETPQFNLTVENARKAFLNAYKSKKGRKGKEGRKQSTINTVEATLKVALSPLNQKQSIQTLTYTDIEALRDHWYSPEQEISERTALNYCRMAKQFIDWLDLQPQMGFAKPKGTDGLFRLGMPEVDPYVPLPDEIKLLLSSAQHEKCKLLMLLALNCGFTSVDIAALRQDEIITTDSETCIWRKREKTSHQNSFRTLHWLFPETATLLKKYLAPDNPDALALLNKDGKPLQQVLDGFKTRGIVECFETARTKSGVKTAVSFKSFRKFSVTQIVKLTRQENLGRMFAGHKVSGVLRNYLQDDFSQLTAALKQYHEWLITVHIL